MRSNAVKVMIGLFVAVLGLAGCGGGSGGGGTPAPVTSTETFQLKNAYINTLNSSSSPFTIFGTSSGVSITGSGTATESGLTSSTFEGSSCYKQVTTFTGTITGNGTTVPYGVTDTAYYDSSYNYLGSSGSEYTVINGTMSLPLTAKVNDTGIIFTETIYPSSSKSYSTGTHTVSFTLDPDTASTALLKLITTERNTSNVVVSTSISTIRITPSGTFTRLYETYVSSSDNLRLNL